MKRYFDENVILRQFLFITIIVVCLGGFISSPIALLAGFLFTQFIGHPFIHLNHKLVNWLLKASVIGLGFGMNITTVVHVGGEGVWLTVGSILLVLTLGIILGYYLHINKKTTHLVSCGTAICGGSAIAAIAPVIKASEKEISISLGIIFLLNSLALFIFPVMGHWLQLTQHQFGLWCAIAIHDTSSVVAAANSYGVEALQTATVVKLARALWIIPASLITAVVFSGDKKKINIPWFIGLYIIVMLLNSYSNTVHHIGVYVVDISKRGLVLTLFLIGAGLSLQQIKAVGFKPLLLGITLWMVVMIVSLEVIRFF
jgi:uncharacterized integral membrane protein (TIGR00698 family)